MPTRRAVRHSFTVLAATAVLSGTLVGVANATPPGIPTATTAKSELATLTVKADGTLDGYSRDKFPHWIDQGGSCNTREVVLKRDGTNVVTDSSCAATSGKWFSPYDGATWTAASDVDIDHVVPLADAWRTGAASWTTAQRQAYANDLTDPQLIAVTDNVNQEKGDKSPDAWKPPLTSYWCTYAKMWVAVKYKFKLTINSAEKTALTDMLNRC
ncbi:HNH endonuclease family protein [Amycolatopsis nalaikhensis]|uniref:HNH endonuclease family protein n=1 Tax=Amycolatopsis nalaikhensis TaxID=715472 RepID=A0ABY8XW07_9PSEU|nr:HNH endonuclease family protein [Amycolatopsis sp. 2-2]WIV59843.1 HNH endonuclease family protein [Amycolatopsis sp. 2-2]